MEVHERLMALRRQIEMLHAEETTLFARWDTSNVWADNGSKSSAHRYARETGISITEAKRIKTRARTLLTMPATMFAFACGELTTGRVDMLVCTNQERVADLFARDEEMLVDEVKKLSFKDAQRFLDYWLLHADPDGAEDRAEHLFECRSGYAARTFENCVDVRALLDPVGGEIFIDELERLETQLFEQDWAEAKEHHGRPIHHGDLRRTCAQRRADALVLMAKRSASAVGGSNKPLLTVVMGQQSLQRLCELGSGTVIAPGQFLPYLHDALFERIVFDPKSRTIDVRHRRSFVGAVRRAIEVRDQQTTSSNKPHPLVRRARAARANAGARHERRDIARAGNWHNRAKGSGPP
jgi:hypothetical protein